nr:TonB-dependent receptor plug domain-containing protein [Psychrobacter sp. PraFG1]UNK04401.1 TonB-dependent receptor plug domain-containing protein [Psychrobacter sp. PraFG1]
MLATLPSIASAVEIHNAEADNTVENATTTPTPKTQANERIHRAAAPTVMLDTIQVVASNNDISEDSDSYVFENASTATGLALSPQYTPQSVTTITHQQIEDQDLEDVADVLRHTPGVSLLTFDGGRTMSSARGFDITQYQIDGQDVDFNGIWTKGEDFTSTAIFDRVEVVRGATGLTSGSGEPSASINLIRKRANSRNPEAMIRVEGDHHGQYGATLDASTPLIKGAI